MKPILIAKQLKKAFYYPQKVDILKSVSLEIHPGESIAITGGSGQGKSTLLQILGTLESACSGTLTIADKKVGSWNKSAIRNQHLAFVFQSFHLLEDYTAIENVLMPAKIAKRPCHVGSEAYNHALELLNRTGLANRALFSTKLLSGGEKQRVAIARALCNRPDIILADEPSGNLDRANATHIHELLLDYVEKEGKSLIVVTHDPSLASLCSSQYHLEDGSLAATNLV